MRAAELEQYLRPTMSQAGFQLSAITDPTTYQDRPAWVIYYLADDCRLQISWSARDGGIDFWLAPVSAPEEIGFLNYSKKWRLMLMLSKAQDDLVTPGVYADDRTEMEWLRELFAIHIESARGALTT